VTTVNTADGLAASGSALLCQCFRPDGFGVSYARKVRVTAGLQTAAAADEGSRCVAFRGEVVELGGFEPPTF
jgi:hypothetical protein